MDADVAPGTATFLFTDIEGSTSLLSRLGTSTYAKVLADHNAVIRSALSKHGGTEIGTQGDGFFAVFPSASACAAAAIAIQRALEATSWPGQERVKVRMGLHVGEAQETTSGPVGFDVHRAARVAAVGHGGQIVVSETAAALLRDSLPDGTSLVDLGQHRLKDLGRPERLFQLTSEGLESNFPALRSLDNPELEHNLPVQLTSFVGRERERQDVHGILKESRLVTLAGPAGSGKTRLALQVAADLLDGSGDGVWLVDFSTLTAEEQVPRVVAGVLGVREESSRPLIETLVEALQYRDLLLLLDNCEHVIDAAALVAETIVRQCQKVLILATSREPLAVAGERVYRVPPLGLPDVSDGTPDPEELAGSEAVRLFVERSREHRPDFAFGPANAAVVASVCRHLDGIPLALELAAARIRSMSLEEVERHLGQRFRLLSSRSRTGAARQQTLEGAVAWSYELLRESEKLLFACLSVFPGSFDLSAAKAVCSGPARIDEFEVVDLLESLVDKSLVQAELGSNDLRYRMLETIGQYAADRLADLGGELTAQVRQAHALFFLDLAEQAAPRLQGFDQTEWTRQLDAEFDNLRTALRLLTESPQHGPGALRMVTALRHFWERSGGTPGEARELAMAALGHPGAQEATQERSAAYLSLGISLENLGEASRSRDAHEQGAAIAREIGDSLLLADHLGYLSFQLYRMGEFVRAKEIAEDAFQIATGVGDVALLARSHERLAIAASYDDVESSRAHFTEAIRLMERIGDRWRLFRTYNNLASTEMQEGNLGEARAHLEAALEHSTTPVLLGVVLLNLATISILEGDAQAGHAQSREALRHLVRCGFWGHLPYAILDIAISCTASGLLEQAAALHGAADAIMEANDVPWEMTESHLRDRAIGQLRGQLGAAAYEAGYARGHEMSRPDVITLALAEGPGPTMPFEERL